MDEWERYWSEKPNAENRIYDRIAVLYRVYILRPRLTRYLNYYYGKGDLILHAGCGSGQVENHKEIAAGIIGLDNSRSAIQIYKENHDSPTLILGDILSLGIKHNSLDGVYNLGVLEHFDEHDIYRILREFNRVMKLGKTAVFFIPPDWGSSVTFLRFVRYILNTVFKRNLRFHPIEISRVKSYQWLRDRINGTGFEIDRISFSPLDFYTNIAVVMHKVDTWA